MPDTVAVAASGSDEVTANTRFVPLKASAKSTSRVSPTVNVTSSSIPTAAGGSSWTVTVNACATLPSVFSAVTVTTVSPGATALRTVDVPDTVAVAASGSDEVTVNTRFVPLKASAKSTSRVSPTVNVSSARDPTAAGGSSLTLTAMVCVAVPAVFSAVIFNSAAPGAPPATVTVDPATDAAAI